MRLHHYSILFVIVAAVFLAISEISTHELISIQAQKVWLDRTFDMAVDAAVEKLVELDSGEIVLHKEESVASFFQGLYSGLGILDNPEKKELLQGYVPVLAVTAQDGYYINYSDQYQIGGYTYLTKRWSERLPYCYEDEDFIYSFTLGDTVTLYDKVGLLDVTRQQTVFQINYKELQTGAEFLFFRQNRPGHFMLNDEMYLLIRKNAIISQIETSLSYYISNHNLIAKNYGITYQFGLPVIDNATWSRSIDSPTFIVTFQGYPYEGAKQVYNRYTVSGAYIKKDAGYWIEKKEWYCIYHSPECPQLVRPGVQLLEEQYYTVKDCAAAGAYACRICHPEGVHN